MFECTILADSTSDYRLTTFQITAPRFILAEINTHKMISKNSASSRAIPVLKSIEAVLEDPFVPESFPQNIKGMTGGDALTGDEASKAALAWDSAMVAAIQYALELEHLNVHKGWANRIIEPYKWHTCIMTGTDWSNFFALRTAENAQPEFRHVALMMQEAYESNQPRFLSPEEWHLPLCSDDEIFDWLSSGKSWGECAKISAARCARVSYLTHEGVRDVTKDLELANFLMGNGHLSPFEHVARPFDLAEWKLIKDLQTFLHDSGWMARADNEFAEYLHRHVEYRGNLRGWHFLRADIPNEHDYSLVRASSN